jgi:hypothetical protein
MTEFRRVWRLWNECLQDQSESLADLRKVVHAVDRLCEQEALNFRSPGAFAPDNHHRPENSFIRGIRPRGTGFTLAQTMVAAASIFIGVRFIR